MFTRMGWFLTVAYLIHSERMIFFCLSICSRVEFNLLDRRLYGFMEMSKWCKFEFRNCMAYIVLQIQVKYWRIFYCNLYLNWVNWFFSVHFNKMKNILLLLTTPSEWNNNHSYTNPYKNIENSLFQIQIMKVISEQINNITNRQKSTNFYNLFFLKHLIQVLDMIIFLFLLSNAKQLLKYY